MGWDWFVARAAFFVIRDQRLPEWQFLCRNEFIWPMSSDGEERELVPVAAPFLVRIHADSFCWNLQLVLAVEADSSGFDRL